VTLFRLKQLDHAARKSKASDTNHKPTRKKPNTVIDLRKEKTKDNIQKICGYRRLID
jgi:uncharacterized protein YcbK (DUF882 family)